MKTKVVILVILILIFVGAYFLFSNYYFDAKAPIGDQVGVTMSDLAPEDSNLDVNANSPGKDNQPDIEAMANGLNIPWEIVFLPSGEMLVTERSGKLLIIGEDKKVIEIDGVEHIGEGGLQGLDLHPGFSKTNWIYLYLTTKSDNGLVNRVERYKLDNNKLTDRQVILDNIPGAKFHDGGRIKFGPDNMLYVATGDATQKNKARNLDYLGGKILRIDAQGRIPDDNPFPNSPVFSLGHRNPQGLAWDDAGRLWSTEHGRSVPLSGYDELNLISAGADYGWPEYQGDEEGSEVTVPIIHSGPDYTWAPAGLTFLNGSLFFAGLKGESLYEYSISADSIKAHFFGDFGRLRAVTVGPDRHLYFSTSNTDGRGIEREDDDKIIRINPDIFK